MYDKAKKDKQFQHLVAHWNSTGLPAGHQGSEIFDPVFYLDTWGDLKAKYGKDYRGAARHFVEFGQAEGRVATKDWKKFAGAQVLQYGGRAYIPAGAVVIVSDNTPATDDPKNDQPGFPIPAAVTNGNRRHLNVKSWDDAIDRLKGHQNKLTALVLAGHGSRAAGVVTRTPATPLDVSKLEKKHIDILMAKLQDSAPVLILGCEAAKGSDAGDLKKLSNLLKRPVIAHNRLIFVNNEVIDGQGQWILAWPDPLPENPAQLNTGGINPIFAGGK
jgi:hypothetical protein